MFRLQNLVYSLYLQHIPVATSHIPSAQYLVSTTVGSIFYQHWAVWKQTFLWDQGPEES